MDACRIRGGDGQLGRRLRLGGQSCILRQGGRDLLRTVYVSINFKARIHGKQGDGMVPSCEQFADANLHPLQ